MGYEDLFGGGTDQGVGEEGRKQRNLRNIVRAVASTTFI